MPKAEPHCRLEMQCSGCPLEIAVHATAPTTVDNADVVKHGLEVGGQLVFPP